MGEKLVTKVKQTIVAICIILIFSLSGILIFNHSDKIAQDKGTFSLNSKIGSAQISTKPDYVVYPTIPNITITHEDNISLYASSGDGLSPETAFIIENITL